MNSPPPPFPTLPRYLRAGIRLHACFPVPELNCRQAELAALARPWRRAWRRRLPQLLLALMTALLVAVACAVYSAFGWKHLEARCNGWHLIRTTCNSTMTPQDWSITALSCGCAQPLRRAPQGVIQHDDSSKRSEEYRCRCSIWSSLSGAADIACESFLTKSAAQTEPAEPSRTVRRRCAPRRRQARRCTTCPTSTMSNSGHCRVTWTTAIASRTSPRTNLSGAAQAAT